MMSGPAKTIVDMVESAPEFGEEPPCAEDMAGDSAPNSPSRPAEDGQPAAPRALGFDLECLNREYALVILGSKAVVYAEQPHAPLEEQKRVIAVETLNYWFANRFTEVRGSDGKIKTVTWAKAWLSSRERRSYRGVEFFPDPDNAAGTPDYLNLWSGFAVKPAPKSNPRAYKTFRDHMLTNVCRGDEAIFKWLFAFFAQMVQRPRERAGVAVVMRGKMGSGKTKVGEVFGSLLPRHYFLVDDPRYVTGQFNAHMATCLLLQADEAVWAGDKAAEGRLKGLVTSPIQQIEAKGVDPIRLRNYVRLIMTSNEDWVVPAGKDERRFCVLDIDPRCAQQHEYFAEMDEELNNGGREALLRDLLDFDLSSVNLRQIPRTEALLEQKIRSLDSVDAWWFERLMTGATTRHGWGWRKEMPSETLFEDYVASADKIGVKRKQEQTVFGMKLAKLVPGLGKRRISAEVRDQDGATVQRRVWCYVLPSLDECREEFERQMCQEINWPREPADDDGGAHDIAA